MIRKIAIIAFICTSTLTFAQQSAQFSQYMFNLLAINPGFAGSSDAINLAAVSRQQWVGIDGHPKTTVFGADAAISPFGINSGIGISFTNDEIGYFNDISFHLAYAYRKEILNGSLGIGVQMGLFNQVLSGEWYIPDPVDGNSYHQPSDNLVLNAKTTGNAMDFGMGAYYSEDKFYVGLSAIHLFNPVAKYDSNNFYYLKRTVFLASGYRYQMRGRQVELLPSLLFKTDGVSWQTDLNLNARYKKRYWAGCSYRYQDAIVLMAGMELKSGLRLGYSYDITTSPLAKYSNGSHEVMVGYSFSLSVDKKTKQYKSVRYL
jgi:type IX secretion system PorP/SprF family membrane protein